jgi:hypothetical protein
MHTEHNKLARSDEMLLSYTNKWRIKQNDTQISQSEAN